MLVPRGTSRQIAAVSGPCAWYSRCAQIRTPPKRNSATTRKVSAFEAMLRHMGGYSTFPKTTLALVPPKPKELDRA